MAATRTRVLGTTRLLEPIGAGGMAEVYSGIQEPLNRRVAIKVMLPNVAKQRKMAERFRREALTLASLAHENIVAIHDLVEKNNQLFLITEFVDGVDTLKLLKERGPMPLDVALLIGAGVASALEHAHFRRIVHRDIKPANVMLSRSGQVKLMDFGIAKDLTVDDLTKTGALVGTPSYLAPELLSGARPHPTADIYALGVLMFNCISGRKPFVAENPGELVADIVAGRRRKLRDVAPDVPKGVVKLVEQCLEVDPNDRVATAALLRWQLETHASRLVKTTAAERIIAFLQACELVDDDDLTGLALNKGTRYETSPDLETPVPEPPSAGLRTETDARPPARRRLGLIALASLAIVALAAVLGSAMWPDRVGDWIQSVLGG